MFVPWGFGVLAGFCGTAMANTARKLPIMRNPWEHVISMSAGGYLFYKVEDAKDFCRETIAQQEKKAKALANGRGAASPSAKN